uniref:Collagen type VI alpha 6 chain n=1 Tax=Latimeria chalumnae TaxID=7897 RepID=H3AU32_LATCH
PSYADVVFLVDSSRNIGPRGFKQVKEFIIGTITHLDIGMQKYRIGVAQYSDDAHTQFLLKDFKARNPMISFIRKNITYKGGSLRTGHALKHVQENYFNESTGSRLNEGYPQILVVVTSGKSKDDIVEPAKYLKTHDVNIITLGLQNSVFTELEAIGSPQHVFQLSSTNELSQFAPNVSNVIQTIAQTQDSSPAGKAENCFNVKKDMMGWAGSTICKKMPESQLCRNASVADIVFLVDESGSIEIENFKLIVNFLHRVVDALDVNETNVRIGLVLYSSSSEVYFYLNTSKTKDDVLTQIKKLPYRRGGTNTGAAIDLMREQVFTKKAGSRKSQGVQQIAFVITDGKSEDNVVNPATRLRRAGVTVFAVGIKAANKTELYQIASHPPQEYVSTVDNFTQLANIETTIQNKICNEIITKTFENQETELLKEVWLGCIETEEADIYFLIDGSGSIEATDFIEMKTFLIEVVKMFNIGPENVRVGAVQYASQPEVEFNINQHANKDDLGLAIQNIRQVGGGTETGRALETMLTLMKEGTQSRTTTAPRYLVVLTDGKSQDTVTQAAQNIRNESIIVYAIGVKEANVTELQQIAGDDARWSFVQNFDSLKDIKNKVVQEICSGAACKNVKADIIFLIDSSTAMKQDDFEMVKKCMEKFVNKSDIGEGKVQIAAIQFNDTQKEEFQLNTYTNKKELQRAIQEMERLGGKALTGAALNSTLRYFEKSKVLRSGVRKFLIVFAAGKAKDNIAAPAKALRDNEITIYSLGTFKTTRPQLVKISGTQDRAFHKENFDELLKEVDQIINGICSPLAECKKIEAADIVFVVDVSGSINSSELDSMKNFMKSVVRNSKVAPDQVQFGVVRYANDPEKEFHLNDFTNKRQVRTAIHEISLLGGDTYTAKALNFSQDLFAPKYGGRKPNQVSQVLILITDGESTDRYKLNATAKSIIEKGITIYAIGIEGAKEEELWGVSGSRDKFFYVRDFQALERLQQNFSSIICKTSNPVCNLHQADIVFLVDGSSSIIPEDFSKMKDFLKNLVDGFDIAPNNIQVAVAQYSTIYEEQFKLNALSSKTAIKNKIETIKQIGGGTLIGSALRSVKTLFQTQAGSRKSSRVPQYLLVITDGRSQDEVSEAAEDLRKQNIDVYALGIGDINNYQLIQIAGSSKKKFYVQDFKNLESINKRVVRNICTQPPITAECTIDIAVGFDITKQMGVQSLFSRQPKLQAFLPDILQKIVSLNNISCTAGSKIQISMAFEIPNAKPNFKFRFKTLDQAILAMLKTVQINKPSNLDATFLQSLWERFKNSSTAKAKVILVFTDGLDDKLQTLENLSEVLRNDVLDKITGDSLNIFGSLHQDYHSFFCVVLVQIKSLSTLLWTGLGQVYSSHTACFMERKCSTIKKHMVCPFPHPTRGKRSLKGAKGIKGHQGHPGEEGVPGNRGPQGPDGIEGAPGCQGARGPKGRRGYSGAKGEEGEDGIDGLVGEMGERGLPGSLGEKGDPGYPGNPGQEGPSGERGDPGLRGDTGEPGTPSDTTGPIGKKGKPGPSGDPGPDGKSGASGDTGKKGSEGRRGRPGPEGLRREEGPPGYEGDQGIRGAQGNRGGRGRVGRPGDQGFKGTQGKVGEPGTKGSIGSPGAKGSKGEPGESGDKGERGGFGSRGASGEDGKDKYGRPGKPGKKGDSGFPGFHGPQGDEGDLGSPGDRGPKGVRGKRGVAGLPGQSGDPGERGLPGHMGPKGPNGEAPALPCKLVSYVRDHCRIKQCPVYPTELVIALDMSSDVTPQAFERMKNIVLSLLEDLEISESNCPTGARVAVVSYNANTRYLIRFSDFNKRNLLLKEIENVSLISSSNKRNIGAAMRFVARNLFKRVRQGVLVRKVAVFFTNGQSKRVAPISTAVLEFSALDIIPVVIAFNDVPFIRRAFQTDDTQRFMVIILPSSEDPEPALQRVKLCTLCYDICEPAECEQSSSVPSGRQDMDIAFLVRSSRSTKRSEFEGVKDFLSSMLDQLAIAQKPQTSDTGSRVALIQHAPLDYAPVIETIPAHLEFNFSTYNNRHFIKRHIRESVQHLESSSDFSHAIEWTMKNIFFKASKPRKTKVIFAILTGEISYWDRQKLKEVSLNAKCQGFTLFTLVLGRILNGTELEDLASFPLDQHLLQLDTIQKPELGYAKKFARAFFNILREEINSYPPTDLKSVCKSIRQSESAQGDNTMH